MEEGFDDYKFEIFTLTPENWDDYLGLVKEVFQEVTPDQGGAILFDEDTFNMMYGSPHLDKDVNVKVVYKPTGELIGFMGGIPRWIKMGDEIIKFTIPSWAAIREQHKGKGISVEMAKTFAKFALSKDYRASFAFFEPEEHGIDLGKSLARQTDIQMKEVYFTSKFIVRVFDAKALASVNKLSKIEQIGLGLLQGVRKNKNPRVRLYIPEDGEKLFELMDDHVQRNQMAIVREKDDFMWFLKQPGVFCVVHEDEEGMPDGFMMAWKFNLAGFGKALPFGWLDLVHTYRLSAKDTKDLAKYLAYIAKNNGLYGLQTPYFPYFPHKPLQKAKYIFYPKKLIMSIFMVENLPVPDPLKTFYFDWR